MTALLVLAQHTQEDTGWDAWLIAATIVAVLVCFALVFLVVVPRVTRRSRGGVTAPRHSQRRGEPPSEGIRRGG
jgi:hypothetical protein